MRHLKIISYKNEVRYDSNAYKELQKIYNVNSLLVKNEYANSILYQERIFEVTPIAAIRYEGIYSYNLKLKEWNFFNYKNPNPFNKFIYCLTNTTFNL